MTFQPVPNGRKIELNGVQNGIPIVNVFYVTSTEDPTEANLTDIAEAVIDWFNAHSVGWHTSYTLSNVTVTDVSTEDSVQVVVSPATGGVGTGGGTAAAANAAAVVSWRTGRIGRSFRGRTYFGAMGAAQLSNAQTLDPASVTFYADLGSDLIDALTAISSTLVVVSRVAAGVVRTVALVTEIVSIIVDAKVDSQRRRTAN